MIDITQLDIAVLEAMYSAMKGELTLRIRNNVFNNDDLIMGLAQVSAAIDIVKQRETVASN